MCSCITYSFVAFRGRQGFNWGYTSICGQYWVFFCGAYSVEQTYWIKWMYGICPGICCTIFTPYFSKPGLQISAVQSGSALKTSKWRPSVATSWPTSLHMRKVINRNMDNEIFFGLNLCQRIILSVGKIPYNIFNLSLSYTQVYFRWVKVASNRMRSRVFKPFPVNNFSHF